MLIDVSKLSSVDAAGLRAAGYTGEELRGGQWHPIWYILNYALPQPPKETP